MLVGFFILGENMYCIEKLISNRSTSRIKNVLKEYFTRDNSSKTGFHDHIIDKYISSEKGFKFVIFLKNINLTPAEYTTNKKRHNDIRAILKFLSHKSKFRLKDYDLGYIWDWELSEVNRVLWTEFTDLQTLYSSLSQYLIAKVKENPDYFGGQYLLYYWVMFEVQFRLTKAEKQIWEQGLEEFMQYVYGKLAILQTGK